MAMKKPSKEHIKPCPFCGGEAHILIKESDNKAEGLVELYVECEMCIASVWGDWITILDYDLLKKIENVVVKWNTRVE